MLHRLAMVRLGLILPLTLAACGVPAKAPPLSAPARSGAETTTADLRGRWTINAVDGSLASGLWLELGGEGVATITTKGNAIYVASPQPATRAFLGCNWWDPSGWTRSGDKLILGLEMSHMTERGCDPATEALEEATYEILRKPMTMELASPNRLRLANEKGTLELIRNGVQPK